MPGKICFVYVWATAGGVERVFLNRSEALLRRYPKLDIEVYFYNDLGGIALFNRYIKARQLTDRLRVADTFDPSRYGAIFAVDTPRLLMDHPSIGDRVFMECHTPYADNRAYLRQWQRRLTKLIVPSADFQRVIEGECPMLQGKVVVIRNFVPRLPEGAPVLALPNWSAPVFLYFARIDDNKNFAEFVAGISYATRYLGKQPLGIACGPIVPDYPLTDVIERNHARGSVIVLPPIPFESGHVLLRSLRERKAVFVSCSKGESFGLSAAEAMTAGLPVVLSDLPPHSSLVSGRAKFLYRTGNVEELAMKMAAAVEHYDDYGSECMALSREFSEEAFLADWERLFAMHPGMLEGDMAAVGSDR